MTVKKLIKADRLGDAVPPAEQWDYGKWYVVKAGTRPGPYGYAPRLDWSKLKWAKKLQSFKFETIKQYLHNLDVFGAATKPSPGKYRPETEDGNSGGNGLNLQEYDKGYVQSHDVKRATGTFSRINDEGASAGSNGLTSTDSDGQSAGQDDPTAGTFSRYSGDNDVNGQSAGQEDPTSGTFSRFDDEGASVGSGGVVAGLSKKTILAGLAVIGGAYLASRRGS